MLFLKFTLQRIIFKQKKEAREYHTILPPVQALEQT